MSNPKQAWLDRLHAGEFTNVSNARKSLGISASRQNWPESYTKSAEEALEAYFQENGSSQKPAKVKDKKPSAPRGQVGRPKKVASKPVEEAVPNKPIPLSVTGGAAKAPYRYGAPTLSHILSTLPPSEEFDRVRELVVKLMVLDLEAVLELVQEGKGSPLPGAVKLAEENFATVNLQTGPFHREGLRVGKNL